MRYIFEPDHGDIAYSIVLRLFLDPFIAMLCIGALGHQLHLTVYTARFGYWQSWLMCSALQALWPMDRPGKYVIKRDGDA